MLREDRGKVARGGASKRKTPSLPGQWIQSNILSTSAKQEYGENFKVLDFGCGYGLDADVFSWEKYDPCYFDRNVNELVDNYSHVIMTYVISALSEENAKAALETALSCLNPSLKTARLFICLPRNLPKTGKFSGFSRRPQANIYITGEGVETVYLVPGKFEIYSIRKDPVRIRMTGFMMT